MCPSCPPDGRDEETAVILPSHPGCPLLRADGADNRGWSVRTRQRDRGDDDDEEDEKRFDGSAAPPAVGTIMTDAISRPIRRVVPHRHPAHDKGRWRLVAAALLLLSGATIGSAQDAARPAPSVESGSRTAAEELARLRRELAREGPDHPASERGAGLVIRPGPPKGLPALRLSRRHRRRPRRPRGRSAWRSHPARVQSLPRPGARVPAPTAPARGVPAGIAPSGMFDNLVLFLGLEGSKQPQDFGVNATFGGRSPSIGGSRCCATTASACRSATPSRSAPQRGAGLRAAATESQPDSNTSRPSASSSARPSGSAGRGVRLPDAGQLRHVQPRTSGAGRSSATSSPRATGRRPPGPVRVAATRAASSIGRQPPTPMP